MLLPLRLLRLLGLATLLTAPALAQKPPALTPAYTTAPSLLANGDFSSLSPSSPVAPAPWPAQWTLESPGVGRASLEKEAGVAFLRLAATAPAQLVLASQIVPLPPDARGLVVQARFRTKDVKFGKDFLCDARTRFSFLDASGKSLGKGPPDLIFNSHAKLWTDLERQFLVPEGAAAIKVNVCLNRPASGTLDLASLRLVRMDPAVAAGLADAPRLAQEKRLADEAEALRLAGLPPVTRPLRVSGNQLLDDRGRPVLLRGVNVPSLEWSARGEQVHRSLKVALLDWRANAIRLPVHNAFWFGRGKGKEPPNDAEAYRRIIDEAVKIVAGQGAWLILDLHLYGGPRQEAVEFWQDAAARYKNHPAVLFDLYNEPHGISWELWQKGGPREVTDKQTGQVSTVQVVGMQALVDAVRSTGARNVVIAGGLAYSFDLSGVLTGFALTERGGDGIMYATHFYNWHRGWEQKFLAVSRRHPVLVGEFGADVKKMSFIPAHQQEDPYTFMPDALAMIQQHGLHYTAFSFHPAATPVLLKDWTYEPTPFFGAFVKAALAGEKFELKKLR